jgi:hypothetical protein
MTREELIRVRNAVPFQPFMIHLAGGRSLMVPHRDFTVVPPGGRVIEVFVKNGVRHLVDLMLVTDLEVTSAPLPVGEEKNA